MLWVTLFLFRVIRFNEFFFPTFKTEDGWSIGTSVCGTQFLVTRDGPQNPMAGIDRLAQKHGIQAAESHGFLHLGS